MIRKLSCFALCLAFVAGSTAFVGCNPSEPVAGTATNASLGPGQDIDGQQVHGGVTKVD